MLLGNIIIYKYWKVGGFGWIRTKLIIFFYEIVLFLVFFYLLFIGFNFWFFGFRVMGLWCGRVLWKRGCSRNKYFLLRFIVLIVLKYYWFKIFLIWLVYCIVIFLEVREYMCLLSFFYGFFFVIYCKKFRFLVMYKLRFFDYWRKL